jgi:hypothetical protein
VKSSFIYLTSDLLPSFDHIGLSGFFSTFKGSDGLFSCFKSSLNQPLENTPESRMPTGIFDVFFTFNLYLVKTVCCPSIDLIFLLLIFYNF